MKALTDAREKRGEERRGEERRGGRQLYTNRWRAKYRIYITPTQQQTYKKEHFTNIMK